jgi:5-methyltetrahydrofolate--homocysteine methyltransferase
VARGLDLNEELPEAWLRARPDDVRALHEEFARAGADVLQTNTFGLLRRCLADAADGQDAHGLVATAVALASGAARDTAADSADPPLVVASLGPSGIDGVDLGRVTEACAMLAARFAACGVAAVHLETSYDARELLAALRGVRQGAPGLPLIASLTLNVGNSGLETPLGTPLASMLRAMDREPPDATGLNCSQSARRMGPSVAALRRWTGGHMPILVQPQVDQTAPDCKRRTPPETDAQFVHGLLALLEAGADAVGGCCGCRGSHLAAARRALSGATPGAERVTL